MTVRVVALKRLAKEHPKKQEEIRTFFLLAAETRDLSSLPRA
jgi:hypothetical protein